MVETYRVAILTLADRDIQEQFDYLKQRSPHGAAAWYEELLGALQGLSHSPLVHAQAPENPHIAMDIRQAIFKTRRGLPYRILFTILDREVRVLRVRGPGQDLLDQSQLF